MAYLFTVEGKVVKPHDETLLISPFKEIWERDKSKNKVDALEDFTYIEFMVSMLKTNPYRGYSDKIRKDVLLKDIIKRENWKEDSLIKEGMIKLKEFQTQGSITYSLYLSAIKAKNKLESFFDEFDMSERNFKTGLPVYKPKEITSALLDVDKVTSSLVTLQKKVEEELFEEKKIRGQKEISPFANPESLR